MQEININVTETGCQRSPLLIGYQGENEVTRVIVDYSAWTEEFGAGSLALEVMRSGDEIPYLAPLTIADGEAVWLVSNVDTGAEGVGAAGFVYTVGDQIKKSAVFRFFVGRDIGGDPGERPDPYEGVIAHIEKLVKEAEDNAAAAETAQGAAETAQGAAETAQTAAEAARDAAASSATDAAGSATTATEQAQAAETAQQAAEAAQTAAETAQGAAETAQNAAETARDAAASSATDAAGSATSATEQAQAAATARAAAETAQTAAEAARDAAASSATDAAGSATTATEQAQAAATAKADAEGAQRAAETAQNAAEAAQGAAEAAQQAIEDLTVSAEEIDTAGPTAEKQVDPQTGAVNLNFGFAKNQATESTTIGPAPIVAFDASAADMPLKGLTVDIEPVQSGSGDPSPDNVRPISGWAGCNVLNSNKNYIKFTPGVTIHNGVTYTVSDDGSILLSGAAAGGTSVLKRALTTEERTALMAANKLYFAGGTIDENASTTYGLVLAKIDGTVLKEASSSILEVTTLITDIAQAQIIVRNGTNVNGIVLKPILAIASEATILPISWESEAGTVYGGTLTVNADGSGELVVQTSKHIFDGTENFNLNNTNEYSLVNDFGWKRRSKGGSGISNYITITNKGTGYYYNISDKIYLYWHNGGSVADFKSVLASLFANDNPLEIVHDLMNPVKYDLTADQITTLLGTNNIWADTGDVTVTYGAYLETVKAHAERLGDSILSAIAPLETTYTASRAYAVGEFLFVGTKFYKVTQAIGSGDTINPGTNVTQTTVAAQLMELAGN